MKGKRLLGLIGVLMALVTVLAGCEATPTSSVSTTSSAIAGRLQINITDAPSAPEIEQVWITVESVNIHTADNDTASPTTTTITSDTTSTTTTTTTINSTETESNSGWLSLNVVGDARFNLLDLQKGLQAKLAIGDLAAEKYTQIRMDVTKVEIKLKGDNDLKEAKLPSNTLKFVHPFEIVSGQVTEILFDFDALKSINETGNGKYICKPVIKLTTTKEPKAVGKFEITTPSLPNGVVGLTYAAPALTTTGGIATYTWSLESVTPVDTANSLSIDPATGALNGSFGTAGDYTITVKVTDGSTPQKRATKTFNVQIAANGALQIVTTSLPDGTVGVAYPGYALNAVNITGAYSWSSADIPTWLNLTAAGVISGNPTTKGNYSFTVTLTDTISTDTQLITITINKAP